MYLTTIAFVVLFIVLIVIVIFYFHGKNKKPEGQMPAIRAIVKKGLFNRYEVVEARFYGLQGLTRYEVDICIGMTTIDSCGKHATDFFTFQLPANHTLIKSNFYKDEEG